MVHSKQTHPSVAIIGSFRKHLAEMRSAIDVFTSKGIGIVNPLSTEPIEEGVSFVRFPMDNETLSDAEVEDEAMKRIMGATAVYVICPGGYMGKTTCYEMGILMYSRRPVYLSQLPKEPLVRKHANGRIVTPDRLSSLVLSGRLTPWPEPAQDS